METSDLIRCLSDYDELKFCCRGCKNIWRGTHFGCSYHKMLCIWPYCMSCIAGGWCTSAWDKQFCVQRVTLNLVSSGSDICIMFSQYKELDHWSRISLQAWNVSIAHHLWVRATLLRTEDANIAPEGSSKMPLVLPKEVLRLFILEVLFDSCEENYCYLLLLW